MLWNCFKTSQFVLWKYCETNGTLLQFSLFSVFCNDNVRKVSQRQSLYFVVVNYRPSFSISSCCNFLVGKRGMKNKIINKYKEEKWQRKNWMRNYLCKHVLNRLKTIWYKHFNRDNDCIHNNRRSKTIYFQTFTYSQNKNNCILSFEIVHSQKY